MGKGRKQVRELEPGTALSSRDSHRRRCCRLAQGRVSTQGGCFAAGATCSPFSPLLCIPSQERALICWLHTQPAEHLCLPQALQQLRPGLEAAQPRANPQTCVGVSC